MKTLSQSQSFVDMRLEIDFWALWWWLGAVLDPAWGVLGKLWAVLERCWRHFGGVLAGPKLSSTGFTPLTCVQNVRLSTLWSFSPPLPPPLLGHPPDFFQ